MKEGLYRAKFNAAGGSGEGLIVLSGGRIWGGDRMIYYTGSYRAEADGTLLADVKVAEHAQPLGYASVFGRSKNRLRLEGKWTGDTGRLEGRSDQASGIVIKIEIAFLSE